MPQEAAVLALGRIAHQAVSKAHGLKAKEYPFEHNRAHGMEERRFLVDSYHCSRYNVQTKRLTDAMFSDVFRTIARHLNR